MVCKIWCYQNSHPAVKYQYVFYLHTLCYSRSNEYNTLPGTLILHLVPNCPYCKLFLIWLLHSYVVIQLFSLTGCKLHLLSPHKLLRRPTDKSEERWWRSLKSADVKSAITVITWVISTLEVCSDRTAPSAPWLIHMGRACFCSMMLH